METNHDKQVPYHELFDVWSRDTVRDPKRRRDKFLISYYVAFAVFLVDWWDKYLGK